MILPPPNSLGLPDRYDCWRPNQAEAVRHLIESDLPFHTMIAPTGFGKSLFYVGAAHLSTDRTVILTSTKALMSQLENDFRDMGIVSVKGKNSYICKMENDGSPCDMGPCNAGVKCSYKQGGCAYYDAIRAAQTASLVVTNYAFWMSYNRFGRGLTKPDMLVCDEAHDLPQLVSDFLTCKINRTNSLIWSVLSEPRDAEHMTLEEWGQWADAQKDPVKEKLKSLRSRVKNGADQKVRKQLGTFTNLQKNLAFLSEANSQSWAMDVNAKYLEFAPTWPKAYTNDVLFLGVPKVVLTSATVCEKTTQMLGVYQELNDVVEFPSSFPIANRMLYHIPTVRLNIHASMMDIRQWTKRIDQILRPRMDRKGIIHTTSYERRNHVLAQSEFRKFLWTHDTKDVIRRVSQFKKADPPAFMVSPSLTTGFDFPDDTCRVQILGKLPYPDTRNKIVKARTKEDPDYGAYIAAQGLEQAVGRGDRSATDWCENFIIDDSIGWFIPRFGKFLHKWFLEAYQSVRVLPPPRKEV